jgi:hypothetical protein
MKNILKVAIVATGIFSFGQAMAKSMPVDTTHKVKHAEKSVGHAVAKTGATVDAAVIDKKYAGKCGPDGQTVYINKNSHYYYINKAGHRVYVKKSELKDKPMK